MTSITNRPRVFLDIQIGISPVGRITVELFADKTPKTCENFRALATASFTPPSASQPLTYRLSPFHRIIDDFMIQGGDITKADGTGGASIYGGEFADENIGWREIDREGLVCMVNRGKGTNSSQFFITLAPCPHLSGKHTVFGHVVQGQQVLERLAKVKVDKNDRPLEAVLISQCGELERRGKRPTAVPNLAHLKADADSATPNSSRDRGRKRRRRSMTGENRDSISRSNSRSRSRSRSRSLPHRHPHRHRRPRTDHNNHHPARSPPSQPSRTQTHNQTQHRRRSDMFLDGTLRGRTLTRSPSLAASSPRPADPTAGPQPQTSPSPPPRKRHDRNRGRSPSRSRSATPSRIHSPSPHLRRQHARSRSRSRSRSSEAGRKGQKTAGAPHDRHGETFLARARARAEEEEESIRRLEEEREGGEGRYSGLLPAEGDGEDEGDGRRSRTGRREMADRDRERDGGGRRWGTGNRYGSGHVSGNGKGGVHVGDGGGGTGEVKFKGRGSMKFRERKW